MPIDTLHGCKLINKTFDKCIDITQTKIYPPDYYQQKCEEFESIWPKNADQKLINLIAIGSNTIHNILRLPFEPGLSRYLGNLHRIEHKH